MQLIVEEDSNSEEVEAIIEKAIGGAVLIDNKIVAANFIFANEVGNIDDENSE